MRKLVQGMYLSEERNAILWSCQCLAVGMVLSVGKEWAALAANTSGTASRCYQDREQGPQGRLTATGGCADQNCIRRLGREEAQPEERWWRTAWRLG